MDGGVPSSQGGLIWDTRSGSTPVLGRVSVGAGRTPPRSCRVRVVVGAGEVATKSVFTCNRVKDIALFKKSLLQDYEITVQFRYVKRRQSL